MTLQEVKDQYAKEKGYSAPKEGEYNFGIIDTPWDALYDYEYDTNNMREIQLTFNEIAIRYAAEKCKEQREICAAHSEVWIVDQEELHQKEDIHGVGVYEKSILNAPAPKMD